MKILIVQPWIRLGGAELTSINLAYQLQQRGYRAPIACLFFDPEGLPKHAGLVEYLLPPPWISRLISRNRIAFLLFGPWILAGLVWKHSLDAAVINSHEFPTTWIGVLVGLIRRIPTVWTSYGPTRRFSAREIKFIGLPDWLGWLVASSYLDRVIVRHVSAIYVPSQRSKNQIRQRYSREPEILPPGIDAGFYGAGDGDSAIAEYGQQGKFLLLCVGKLHPQENQSVCIHALKHVLDVIPNASLIIAGGGPMARWLRQNAAEIGVEQHVHFIGHVSSAKVRDLYKACAIHLYPPVDESWGSTPFEALAAGKVSVVSDESGAAEVISQEGLGVVCEPTPRAFIRHIVDVYQNPAAYEWTARKGRDFVQRNLSWDAYADGFLKIVLRVVDESSIAGAWSWGSVEDSG